MLNLDLNGWNHIVLFFLREKFAPKNWAYSNVKFYEYNRAMIQIFYGIRANEFVIFTTAER
jgi:hypothetical protein